MEFYIGQIILFGGNFAIRNFSLAQGQLLAINQYQALFSLYGTTYGGDGRTTFGLPDLRGRTALSQGTGPGLSPRPLGQRSGSEQNFLNQTHLPSHSHTLVEVTAAAINTSTEDATGNNPSGTIPAATDPPATKTYAPIGTADATLGGVTQPQYQAANTGNSQAINNMQPYLVINYEVCLVGIFPSRN